MKLLQLFLHFGIAFLSKYLKPLLDAALGQDGLIFDDVGWWGRFNRGSDGINDVNIGHGKIMEVTGNKNQVAPSHGESIGSFIIAVDGGRIL